MIACCSSMKATGNYCLSKLCAAHRLMTSRQKFHIEKSSKLMNRALRPNPTSIWKQKMMSWESNLKQNDPTLPLKYWWRDTSLINASNDKTTQRATLQK